ncbi:flavin reductase [Aspergillus luchuensis]|uniref:Flavin reductase n=1 Tax=Aspergillus kawachii TaxID=1069201 RepID=A0A146FG72_ASPKA|nr:flavin reductase [Aspergillus luchuensis]
MVDVGPQRGAKTTTNYGAPLRPIMKQIPAGIHFWLFAFSRRQKQPHGPGTELLAELQMARISPVNLPDPQSASGSNESIHLAYSRKTDSRGLARSPQ